MGSYSTPDREDGKSDDEEDKPPVDAPLTDYEDEETEDEDDTAAGVIGDAAGAAAGASAAGASGGAGAGAAAGAGAGTAVGGSSDGSGDDGTTEDEEESDTSTSETEPSEEDPENEEDESEDQDEPSEPDPTDERARELREPVSPPEDVGEQEVEEEPPEESEEESEEKEAKLVIETDPWDNAGWGLEPTVSFLQRAFGDKVEVSYEPHPPRVFDADTMRTRWQEVSTRHRMPTNPSVWITDPPATSVQSHRALVAAQEQGDEQFAAYLRRLRIAAQVEGRNIENRDALVALAGEVGLDEAQFAADYNRGESVEPDGCPETPAIEGIIGDVPVYWTGFVEQGRAKGTFLGQGMQPEWQAVFETVEGLVEAGTLLSTSEIVAAFPERSEESIRSTLSETPSVEATVVDDKPFWDRNPGPE